MKKRAAGATLIVWVCVPLWGQSSSANCSTPPTHPIDRNGNVLPEYRERDPGRCPPAIEARTPTGTTSIHALAHRPPKSARKEFDRGIQAWRKGHSEEALHHLAEAVRLD